MTRQHNPFVVDRPVGGEQLCGREALLERLRSAAAGPGAAGVSGRRGSGLTSVARELARRLAAEGWTVVVVDVAGRTGSLPVLRDALSALRDRHDLQRPDPRGDVGREGGGERDPGELIARVTAAAPGNRVHLVLDGLGRPGLPEGTAGMVDAARAEGIGVTGLWQGAAGETPGFLPPPGDEPAGGSRGAEVGPVPLRAWMPHVLESFLRTNRWIANDHVRAGLEVTGGRPLHTQLFFHLLWSEAGPGGRVDEAGWERALEGLLSRTGRRHRLLLDPLTENQRRLLEALARSSPPVRPFSSEFVRRHGFASPSSVQRALGSLQEEGLVEETEEGPRPSDPVLDRWLRRTRAERWPPGASRPDRGSGRPEAT